MTGDEGVKIMSEVLNREPKITIFETTCNKLTKNNDGDNDAIIG